MRRSVNTASILPVYFLAGIGILAVLQQRERRDQLRVWLAVLLVLWMADGYVQFLFGHDLLGRSLTPDGRVTGVFNDSLRLSWFVALLLPLLLADARARPVAIGALLVIAAAILEMLIGTRGALLSVLLVAAGWIICLSLATRIGMVALLAIAIGAGTLLSPLSAERLGRLQQLTTPSFENLDNILSGRMTIWRTATNMLAAHPLNGVGGGAFAAAYDRYSTLPGDMFRSGGSYQGGPTHAHQMYISIAAETGLIGLAGVLGVVTLCIVWYYRAARETRLRAWPWGLGLVAIAFPVQSQPVLFTHWWFPVMLLVLCAMLAALSDNPPAPPQASPSSRT
jgi:O-antigen ligase